jgi:Predicted kinase
MFIVTFGLPGSGKSFFADHLATTLALPHLKSDDIRDQLQKRGAYDSQSKAAVYRALFSQAGKALQTQHAVIVDATFHQAWMRGIAYETADQHQEPLRFIELQADEATIRQRVNRDRPDSDADLTVYQELRQEAEPFTPEHLVLHSDQMPVATMLTEAYQYLNLTPALNS